MRALRVLQTSSKRLFASFDQRSRLLSRLLDGKRSLDADDIGTELIGLRHRGFRFHLDLSSDDRAAESARHESLGATIENASDRGFTVLVDPGGRRYCVTDLSEMIQSLPSNRWV